MQKWKVSQRRIGITGSIASGKTSAGRYLEEKKNLIILDADLFSRQALAPGTISTKAVVKRYGSIILEKKSNLEIINRKKLGEIIFQNKQEKIWLESILHPIVEQRFNSELDKNKFSPTIVLIIPLLFEANLSYLCSEIWLVSCSKEKQIDRIINRDKVTREIAEQRISAQWSLEIKEKLSDKVILNNGSLSQLYKNVESLI
ncbi:MULTISPECIES: dephospho-CoA kinase [Prochlorococcus]|uniref:dephospho-CoA kinase n=1 Tax=Prochlorococcus TaxID=1218 RepID=UPI0005338D83|nr:MULTISPECIES: dephospho-CoA kinase [Prochlorococcus]KGG13338.1 Dephospho-CoA kinase [Prochlorococcus sp. MIT 0601]